MNIDCLTRQLPNLKSPIATPDDKDPLKASAILIVLHKIKQQWHLLLTRRSRHLSSHAGQISFPGGLFEQADRHLLATAVRETVEEIGLSKSVITVISQLEEHATLTGFRIYPYVSIIENLPELKIEQAEVAEVFSVPLAYVIDHQNQQLESIFYQGQNRDYYKIVWQDRIIWGATARIIVNLSSYLR